MAPLPLIALAAVLVMPSLRAVRVSEDESGLPVEASLVLIVGAGSVLAGHTDLSWWSVPLVVVGFAVTIPALRRIVPAGTLTARRGVPAASAAASLASAASGCAGCLTRRSTHAATPGAVVAPALGGKDALVNGCRTVG